MDHHDSSLTYCPMFQHLMELIGRRWTGTILRLLLNGPSRFNELRRQVPGLSDRLLADRLDELEHEGLIVRAVADETVTYTLTPRGEDIRPVLDAVASFADRWAAEVRPSDRPGRRV